MASSNVVRIPSSSAHSFVTAVLAKYNIPPNHTELIADCLVLTDLRGVDTHGVNRLGGYIERIKHQVLDPNPSLSFDQKTPVMALLDAKNTFGFVAASLAIDKGVEMA